MTGAEITVDGGLAANLTATSVALGGRGFASCFVFVGFTFRSPGGSAELLFAFPRNVHLQ